MGRGRRVFGAFSATLALVIGMVLGCRRKFLGGCCGRCVVALAGRELSERAPCGQFENAGLGGSDIGEGGCPSGGGGGEVGAFDVVGGWAGGASSGGGGGSGSAVGRYVQAGRGPSDGGGVRVRCRPGVGGPGGVDAADRGETCAYSGGRRLRRPRGEGHVPVDDRGDRAVFQSDRREIAAGGEQIAVGSAGDHGSGVGFGGYHGRRGCRSARFERGRSGDVLGV